MSWNKLNKAKNIKSKSQFFKKVSVNGNQMNQIIGDMTSIAGKGEKVGQTQYTIYNLRIYRSCVEYG